jgi:hypothetical protein
MRRRRRVAISPFLYNMNPRISLLRIVVHYVEPE